MGTVMRRAAVVAGAALVLLVPAAGAASAAGGTAPRTHPAVGTSSVPGGGWGTAREAPGTAALQQSTANAQIDAVSCASTGNCTAGGACAYSSGKQEGFVVREVHGAWGKASEVPPPP